MLRPRFSALVPPTLCAAARADVVLANDVNYFGYPPACTADHARLWDSTIEWLLDRRHTPANYCTSSTSTSGCPAAISASGVRT